MALQLYNTLSRQKEDFTPLVPGQVGLYTCGPTVYAPQHLGNMRSYIFEDILKRVLLMNGYQVKHVMNITDVGHLTGENEGDADQGEDKMEKGAKREGKSVWQVADFYTAIFKKNLEELNILEPNVWCKATDYIPEQIALIQKLESKGFAYQTTDGVYFDTDKSPDYGKLAKLDAKGLRAGARVEINPEKRNPTDFALWKFSPPGEKRQMEWGSPWGIGFPGWHIECSAMSMKFLGETLDIHCGGIDHIPVHHTNEIAQSEAATGKQFARYWLHGEFLVENGKKVSKSADSIITLDSLVNQGIPPLAYRYFCLGTHYRKQLNFSLEALAGATKALQNVHNKIATMGGGSVGCAEFEAQFSEAVNDDLNTPQALAVVWELLKSDYPDHAKKQSLLKFDQVLGLGLADVKPLVIPQEVLNLLSEREQARLVKDWTKADALRQAIASHGFSVDDTELGPIIKR